jgi:hypothetical protein
MLCDVLIRTGQSHFIAVLMMPLALCFVVYAVRTYLWRSERISTRDVERWDDPFGPLILASLLILAMLVQFYFKVGLVFQWCETYVLTRFGFICSLWRLRRRISRVRTFCCIAGNNFELLSVMLSKLPQ